MNLDYYSNENNSDVLFENATLESPSPVATGAVTCPAESGEAELRERQLSPPASQLALSQLSALH